MKKFVSVLLSLALLLSFAVPAFAVEASQKGSQIPIVIIGGDGTTLTDKDGNEILNWSNLLSSDSDSDSDKSEIYESIANVVLPFLVEGLLTGNYDNYYKNLQKEIAELFGDALLDNNGEAKNSTGVDPIYVSRTSYDLARDKKDGKGYYGLEDYEFWYDWRLDPMETADKFNDYIQAVKKVTGASEVSIICRCLGTSVVMAYISKYGTDDIHGVSFDGGTVNGAEPISESISGKFKVNANAINRFLADCDAYGMFSVSEFLTATINLLEKGEVFDTVVGVSKETIYYTIIEGVTSALALSTFFTWPTYWAAVKAEDYDAAMEYVFGEEGSEKRTEYAGLIEKIENYNTNVRQHLSELFDEINDNANLCIISKYGCQLTPICESADEIGDQIATVKSTSLGATTSTVYGRLSDKYIANQEEAGLAKYISPDKQVDASTCQYPEQTWFIKGASHSNWTYAENEIAYTVATADKQLTVDDFNWTQFMVYDNNTGVASPMTEENSNTYNWTAETNDDNPTSGAMRLIAFLKSLFKWLRAIFTR